MTAGSALEQAIRELEERLERAQKEVADTKNAINVLLVTLGQSPRFVDADEPTQDRGIRPDQYFRKSITVAAREYLQSKGSAATLEEIIAALKKGGCDLGAHPVKNARISLSKNSRMFVAINEDTFGLWEFYGGRPKTKAASETNGESEIIVETTNEAEGEVVANEDDTAEETKTTNAGSTQ